MSGALSVWSSCGPDILPPFGDAAARQKPLDYPRVESASRLLERAQNCEDRARLLAASRRESGAWLNALSLSSVGLCLDNDNCCWASSRCSPAALMGVKHV